MVTLEPMDEQVLVVTGAEQRHRADGGPHGSQAQRAARPRRTEGPPHPAAASEREADHSPYGFPGFVC